MISLSLVLVLAKPPVLPPLPGEKTMEAEPAPKKAPVPEPKTEPEQEPLVEEVPSPQPAPPRGPAAKQSPAPSSKPPAPSSKPPAMPSQLQPATADELAQLEDDDRVAADADNDAPDRDPPRASKPGDRPLRSSTADDTTLRRMAVPDAPPQPTYRSRPIAPRQTSAFAFGYRLFSIEDALGRQQSWHLGSVEVSPLRGFVRLDFITELGAEGGPAAHDGDRADLMFVEKGGLGLQYPGFVSPFIEFQGGAGFSRVELFDRNDLVFLYTLGLDVGAQWAVTKWLFLHAAIGWIHPTFRRPELSTHYDAFTFKLGFGM